jgi:hypothetical protein
MIYDLERDWERKDSSDGGKGGDETKHRDMVKCRRFRKKFQKMEPIKRADYLGLSFEHNTLCNHYQNVHEDKHKTFGKWTCQFEHSELSVDAFSHEPVELHMEGKLIRSGGRAGKEERRTIVHVFFKDFEFLTEREDKHLLEIPKNVEELCEGQDEEDDFFAEMSEHEQLVAMSMLNQL